MRGKMISGPGGFLNGTRTFVDGLHRAKVPHRFLLAAVGGHGYGLRLDEKCQELKNWPGGCRQWLAQVTER